MRIRRYRGEMSDVTRDEEPPVTDDEPPRPKVVIGPPSRPGEVGVHPPMADSYRDVRFKALLDAVYTRSIELAYARRHINRSF